MQGHNRAWTINHKSFSIFQWQICLVQIHSKSPPRFSTQGQYGCHGCNSKQDLPWEPTSFIFKGCNPYFVGVKFLHFFMGFGVQLGTAYTPQRLIGCLGPGCFENPKGFAIKEMSKWLSPVRSPNTCRDPRLSPPTIMESKGPQPLRCHSLPQEIRPY